MIYIVTYFTGEKWVDFISFTVEEYAIHFMERMKKYFPDLDIIVKSKIADEYEQAFAFSIDVAENTTF